MNNTDQTYIPATDREPPVWIDRAALAGALTVFVYRALLYCLAAGRDDQFFTLWAGEQLAAGNGLVNYNGEPLEISSSLLHVLVIAASALVFPGQVFAINKLMGLTAGACVLLTVYVFRADFFGGGKARALPYAASLATIAFTNDFAYWSLGGLETPYAALLIAVYAGVVTRYWKHPAPALTAAFAAIPCLFALARPEGFFVLIFSGVYFLFVLKFHGFRRGLLVAVLLPTLFWIALAAFRWAMFGMLFPNPVYAKSGPLIEAAASGGVYLLQYVSSSWLALTQAVLLVVLAIYYAAILASACWRKHGADAAARIDLIFVFGLCLASMLVTLLSGGDWMGRSRFVAPIMPCLSVLTMAMLFRSTARACARCVRPAARMTFRAVACGVAAVLAWSTATDTGAEVLGLVGQAPLRQPDLEFKRTYRLGDVFNSWNDLDANMIALGDVFPREARLLGPMFDDIVPALHRARGRITIIAGQMGYFPYALKKRFPEYDLYLIDLHGLATREIAHMGLDRNLGGARGGDLNEIFAERTSPLAQFILSHDPDIIYVRNLGPKEWRAVERAGFVVVKPTGNISYRPTGDAAADVALAKSIRQSIRKRRTS